MSPTSYADEIYNYTDFPFIEEDFNSLDEYLQTANDYLSGAYEVQPAGIIDSDDLGSQNVTVRLYTGVFGNWSTTETFVSTADLAYTKTFTLTDIESNLEGSSNGEKPDYILSTYFDPLFGYTVTFELPDGDTLTDTSVEFDLDFSGDTAYTVNEKVAYANYSSSGNFGSVGTFTASSTPVNLVGSLSSLVGAGGGYKVATNGTTSYVGALHNTLTFTGITSSGETITLNTYEDTTGGKYSARIPEDTEVTSLIFDMSYYYASNDFPDSSNYSNYYFPYMFKADFSGTITVEEPSVTGLIGNIIAWLKNILNAILELPQNIANKVKDVIVSLFVPTPEGLSASFDGLKNMAESKLGFVYTGFSMVYDLLSSIVTGVVEPMDTLTLPRLVIPFRHIDGGEFVLWEEMTFNIVPDGMEVLQNLSKLVTSLVLVWLTMRRCLNYFKDFFGKE